MDRRVDGRRHVYPAVGVPAPLGARVVGGGVQFTIFGRHATRAWLLLFDRLDAEEPSQEIELDPSRDRLGDVWHCYVPGARPGQGYAYRMNGDHRTRTGHQFRPDHWLLDPYALAVAGRGRWGDTVGQPPGARPTRGAGFPKGIVVADDFDWSGDVTLRTPMQDSILYETHLRGFTAHPDAGVEAPGTYRGFMEKIPYLQELGITAVEFLPIHEFNEMEYYQQSDARSHLRNYWGYSTVSFFAPNARYAAGGAAGGQIREFKSLVLALHQAGIEVILDVVFNHTAEGDHDGPLYSFRGIDNSIYYMMEPDGRRNRNYSGCGNTMNCNHPVVRSFILDCLRYWVCEMHVDGFRFDLSAILTRGRDGAILAQPPLVDEIAEDPVLRDAKLIAEPWDASGAYQVGSFPSPRFSEWNGRYRDDVRRYWKGDNGMLGAFAQRLAGSADLYHRNDQSPVKSLNFVTCHDGYTLHDLVSYIGKHNEANGEQNRDGENHNHSFNFGVEGPTEDPEVAALRRRQMKNFIATLMVSQGVPMLLAGDEFANSQQGNNNAYCQDNEISWLEWSRRGREGGLTAFTQQATALRKAHPQLRRTRFFAGSRERAQDADIQWSGPDGGAPDWAHGKALGFLLRSPLPDGAPATLFVACNADARPVAFTVPTAPGAPWRVILHTEADPPPWDASRRALELGAYALAVLSSRPGGDGA